MSERVWSDRQQAIFTAVEDDAKRHLVIEALAGSGKTTTIVEAMSHVRGSESVLAVAFNKSIAEELAPRVPAGVEVMTLHSYGYRAVRAAMPGRDVDKYATSNAVSLMMGREWHKKEARTAVSKIISIGKGCLKGDAAALDALADEYDIRLPAGWPRRDLLATAQQVMALQSTATQGPVDFDDMIWLPAARNLPLKQFDWVFVDETQDLNPAQLSLVLRAIKPETGRIVAVGDRRQAIYGFRGADRQAIPRIISRLKAEVLPLSTTYRCPLAVVHEAQSLVPALQAAPGAALGCVRHAGRTQLERDAEPGDFVLSRTNAPLVALCYRWIKAGKRAVIRGRDVGSDLAAWVRNTRAPDIPSLTKCIDAWLQGEIKRLEAADRDTDGAADRAECLHALCEGAASIAAVTDRIELLFAVGDREDAGPSAGAILLSSTHKAKGLEAERVWLLRDTYRPRDSEEEANLLYVAITRSKGELIYVSDKAAPAAEGKAA